MSNTFGHFFRVTTFGESHGYGLGCVIDGCPAGATINETHIQQWLTRRKPGQSVFTTPRNEADFPQILSGILNGKTLGTPIAIFVKNENQKSKDYDDLANVFRPSHGDFTYQKKYGIRAAAGGGRASARETIGRVAAASIAQQCLQSKFPELAVVGYVQSIHELNAAIDTNSVTLEIVEASAIRCPDAHIEPEMKQLILDAKANGDTLGGIVGCVVRGVPIGWGEPVFDKMEARLAQACLSLPATKSFEIGSGLAGTRWKGSQHNDPFELSPENGHIRTRTNHSGGIQAGITNGMPILLRVGFKPVATLFMPQDTVDKNSAPVSFKPKAGRHDSCVLPRAVPMVEAMVWLTLMDMYLASLGNKWDGL